MEAEGEKKKDSEAMTTRIKGMGVTDWRRVTIIVKKMALKACRIHVYLVYLLKGINSLRHPRINIIKIVTVFYYFNRRIYLLPNL